MSNIFNKSGDGGSFLPSDYVQAKAETRTNLAAVIIFTLVMFALVAAFMVSNRRWTSIKEDQKMIEAAYEQESTKIEILKGLEQTRGEMLDKAKVTTALIEKIPRSVLLAELVMRTPGGVMLTEFELESKRVVMRTPPQQKTKSIKGKAGKANNEPPKPQAPRFNYSMSLIGVAYENNNIADYLSELKGCALLKGVELEFIRDTVVDDTKLRRFRILCKLRDDVQIDELESIQQVADAIEDGEINAMTGELTSATMGSTSVSFGNFDIETPSLFPRSEGGVITKAFDLVHGLPESYTSASAASAGEE